MATKGQKYREWTKEEKYKIIEPLINYEATFGQISKKYNINKGQLSTWINKFKESGMDGLINKKKPGNPMTKYYTTKKFKNEEEKLKYENMRLKIENEMLKKGYLMKGDGTIVKFTR